MKLFASLMFWKENISSIPSKSFHQSKNSREITDAIITTRLFHEMQLSHSNKDYQTYSV